MYYMEIFYKKKTNIISKIISNMFTNSKVAYGFHLITNVNLLGKI